MKKYIKGLVTGILIGAIVASVPAVAENIDVLFNTVRININGVDRVQWDEYIELADGSTAPSSILHNGTTYLPIRTISELTGNAVYWNGDSKTVAVTGQPKNKKAVAEKPDICGNMWEYSTFNDNNGNHYLSVRDAERGYERIYNVIGNIKCVDDGIYFVKKTGLIQDWSGCVASLFKLSFENDINSQDGEVIKKLYSPVSEDSAVIKDDYLFFVHEKPGNGARSILYAYNYVTDEILADYTASLWDSIYNLELKKSDNDTDVVLEFHYETGTGPLLLKRITFNTVTNTFSKPETIETLREAYSG